jgi:subtilisin family serine protease
MLRTRLPLALAGAFALAACTSEVPLPTRPSPTSSSLSAAPSASVRWLVLANASGFARTFSAQVASLGGKVESRHDGAGLAVVSGLSATGAAKLRALGGVSDVQPDQTFKLSQPVAPAQAEATNVRAQSVGNPAAAILFPWQWNMQLIRAPQAWAAGKLGSPDVTVAILDTGIDYDSYDLNGLVDLSRSKSFVDSDDEITQTFFPGRNEISDYNGHGTNVATQVSSKAVVFAGVTSRTTLIGVKVLGWDGSGSSSGVLNGILWAADHGANVANMSLGDTFSKVAAGQYVGFVNRVFAYAAQRGMLITVSAGNSAENLDNNGNVRKDYCDVPHVICTSAVGPATATSDPTTPTFYTNYGRSAIDVAAPGGNADIENGFAESDWPWGSDIASWVWSLCSKTLIDSFDQGVPVLPCAAGNRLIGEIGTSQASPHVAGLAASIVAEQGKGRPSQVKSVILQSAVDLGQPGDDPFYGHGLIDVANALGL